MAVFQVMPATDDIRDWDDVISCRISHLATSSSLSHSQEHQSSPPQTQWIMISPTNSASVVYMWS